ncbi:MAG: stage II sporulation protein M [Actinomycetaceae bacterium]|nr:stage II sporulation protein M [Actinomycetaceae bacterium]
MDSFAFAKVHSPQWERLDELASQPHLSGPESDEFVRLYQLTAGHLATVRTEAPDAEVALRLSALLAKARSKLTGARGITLANIVDFFNVKLPLAFYRVRWWTLAVAIGFIAIFLTVLFYYRANPDMIYVLGSEAALNDYANEAFAAYYREHTNADFAVLVWTNNAWIALQCVAGGITGFFPLFVMWQNAVAVGQAGAVMDWAGSLDIFFQLILPHGLLELTAIFVACGAGLKIFWAAIAPGNMTRTQAIGREGRQTLLVGFGLIIVLFISGLVEGFVTPSYLPWGVKIAIGAVVLALFWAWVLILGRSAARRRFSADLTDQEAGWTVAYAG